ncbi:hypothetical protein B0J17DRAFT_764060 [Rhizoctonia solani]|nr:hypothetical protein B0J17DRAFT_764060 [Rhizoctonia solani]
MFPIRLMGIMIFLSTGTRTAALGFDGERRRDQQAPRLEASGTPRGDAMAMADLSFSDCIAVPVVITTTIMEVLPSTSIGSPNIISPTATCGRWAKDPENTKSANVGAGFLVVDKPVHWTPLPMEAGIPPCQEPPIPPAPTMGRPNDPIQSGRPETTQSTPNAHQAPKPSGSLLPFPKPLLALPSGGSARHLPHIFEEETGPLQSVPQRAEGKLPLLTPGSRSTGVGPRLDYAVTSILTQPSSPNFNSIDFRRLKTRIHHLF